MGGAPPRGQALLRSYLAAHSFPPPPPATCYPRSERRVHADTLSPKPLALLHRNRQEWSNSKAGEAPSSGGWGREGARSEARAEQRLAPGGRSPHNPDKVRLLLLMLMV